MVRAVDRIFMSPFIGTKPKMMRLRGALQNLNGKIQDQHLEIKL